jgi:secondary thiamine-phosphate synthase enzyme
MPVESVSFSLRTEGFGQILDITPQVAEAVRKSNLNSGLVNVSIAGSTAAITTIEYESGVVRDLREAIERLAPQGMRYHHDAAWGDGNGYAHVRAALIGASLSLPFTDKRLGLGTWQQIVLLDFDNRSRSREVKLQLVGE